MKLKNLYIVMVLASFIFIGLLSPTPPSLISTSKAIEVTPDTKVDIHDVVIVNYTLFILEKQVDDQEGTIYVENPDVIKREGVPNSIIDEFPDVFSSPNVGFMEGLLGMKAGEEKTRDVLFSSGKAFNNVTDPYYGDDLFYVIRLKKILLDASKPPTTLFDLPFFVPLVVLIGLVFFLLVIFRIQRYSRTHNLFSLKNKCNSCGNIANVMCGNSGCNTTYCNSCFLKRGRCEVCHSNTMVTLR